MKSVDRVSSLWKWMPFHGVINCVCVSMFFIEFISPTVFLTFHVEKGLRISGLCFPCSLRHHIRRDLMTMTLKKFGFQYVFIIVIIDAFFHWMLTKSYEFQVFFVAYFNNKNLIFRVNEHIKIQNWLFIDKNLYRI